MSFKFKKANVNCSLCFWQSLWISREDYYESCSKNLDLPHFRCCKGNNKSRLLSRKSGFCQQCHRLSKLNWKFPESFLVRMSGEFPLFPGIFWSFREDDDILPSALATENKNFSLFCSTWGEIIMKDRRKKETEWRAAFLKNWRKKTKHDWFWEWLD